MRRKFYPLSVDISATKVVYSSALTELFKYSSVSVLLIASLVLLFRNTQKPRVARIILGETYYKYLSLIHI